MWIVNLNREDDSAILRYAIKTFIYHMGVVPLGVDIYLNVITISGIQNAIISLERADNSQSGEGRSESIVIELEFFYDIANYLSLRYEDGVDLDQHGRVKYSALSKSIQTKLSESFIDIGIDTYRERLIALCSLLKIPISKDIPWGKNTIVLSHDVDDLYGKSLIRYLYWIFRGYKNLKQTWKKIRWWIKQDPDPYFSPIEMCKVEGHYGFKSTFYFMAKSSYITLDEGRRYNVRSKSIIQLIKNVSELGWEIGFHPSKQTFNSVRNLEAEFENLKKAGLKIQGVRRHYLKGVFPAIWEQLQEIGIEYDTTVGWPDRFGARAGTNRPFRVFNYITDKEMDIYELPLTFMDGTLNYENDEQYISAYAQIESKLMHSGCMSFLWHTDRLCDEADAPNWKRVYLMILKSWNQAGFRVISSETFIKEYKKHESKFEIKFNNEY